MSFTGNTAMDLLNWLKGPEGREDGPEICRKLQAGVDCLRKAKGISAANNYCKKYEDLHDEFSDWNDPRKRMSCLGKIQKLKTVATSFVPVEGDNLKKL